MHVLKRIHRHHGNIHGHKKHERNWRLEKTELSVVAKHLGKETVIFSSGNKLSIRAAGYQSALISTRNTPNTDSFNKKTRYPKDQYWK